MIVAQRTPQYFDRVSGNPTDQPSPEKRTSTDNRITPEIMSR